MLKQLILENWKSFGDAKLDIDPLTVLIGTNASGKSNALDALEFLSRIAHGKELQEALAGDSKTAAIRGGVEWASLKPGTQFTLKAQVAGKDEDTDYLYSITVETDREVRLLAESLIEIEQVKGQLPRQMPIFQSKASEDASKISVKVYRDQDISGLSYSFNYTLSAFSSVLWQLPGEARFSRLLEGIRYITNTLQNIFILDPIPSQMRGYSPLAKSLQSDASNIAGVLAALEGDRQNEVESALSTAVAHLPERDIRKVWAEPVGRFNADAMLYCEEVWMINHPPTVIDARAMSDGTLRFLAIITALLTRPEGSQIVVEEVDDGLHPSRSHLLLNVLRELGSKRQIDILVTTHNPALLNALGPAMIPFVVVAHRDTQTGQSKLTLLEEIENLPKLMASGPLGKLTAQGLIEKSLTGVP